MKRVLKIAGLLALLGNCQPVSAALTGQYLFEEGSGTTALDTSPFGRNGTLTNGATNGGPTYTAGLYNDSQHALLFNSENKDVVLLPGSQDYIRNAPGATLLAWVRFDGDIDYGSGKFPTIVQVNNGTTVDPSGVGARAAITDSHNLGFRSVGSQKNETRNGVNSSINNCRDSLDCPVVGQTYFVAGVFDYVNRTNTIYVDGVEKGKNFNIGTWDGGNSDDTANLFASIGFAPVSTSATTNAWHGAIDGVRIFNEALSAETILNTYNAEVKVGVLGDYNGNGVVDAADYVLWRKGDLAADGTGPGGTPDGIVDGLDYDFWRARFGNTMNPAASSTLGAFAAPEPTSVLLLLMPVGLALTARRRGPSR